MISQDRIQPYSANPFYWQYKGKPVLLLGGSIEDNLFQIPDIAEHLALLASVGGNYVRCTMSSRDEGNVWPFERDPHSGKYDLNKPGGEYWARFRRFMELCLKHDIIAQFELWDRFDFARAPWQDNPYNPKNNINYTVEDSGLPEVIESHPGRRENPFFRTVPALEDNRLVLAFQHLQVDTMLAISLEYPNCLYCIDNETNESPEWAWYWARYIREQAAKRGLAVEVTEMWDAHDILDPQHDATYQHPELFTFVDISQNNHNPSDHHWENIQTLRARFLAQGRRWPINSVKIYGANSGRYGSTRDGQERFWRNIMGGLASSRFHRPPSGLGLRDIAQAHIKAARMLTDELEVFSCEPHNDLLQNRSWNEAYCLANPGTEYAVFFPDGGDVLLDVSEAAGRPLTLRWLDIRQCRWAEERHEGEMDIEAGLLHLVTPSEEGYWAALVQ